MGRGDGSPLPFSNHSLAQPLASMLLIFSGNSVDQQRQIPKCNKVIRNYVAQTLDRLLSTPACDRIHRQSFPMNACVCVLSDVGHNLIFWLLQMELYCPDWLTCYCLVKVIWGNKPGNSHQLRKLILPREQLQCSILQIKNKQTIKFLYLVFTL